MRRPLDALTVALGAALLVAWVVGCLAYATVSILGLP